MGNKDILLEAFHFIDFIDRSFFNEIGDKIVIQNDKELAEMSLKITRLLEDMYKLIGEKLEKDNV